MDIFVTFAASEASEEAASGIGALGLNLQTFVFQLITFVLVIVFLKKVALDKLFAALDARRKEVLAGLERAEAAKQQLAEAEIQADAIIAKARDEAEVITKDARVQATQEAAAIETKAHTRADRIVAEAREQLAVDVKKAEREIKQRAAKLVADATKKVLDGTLQPAADNELIKRSLEQAEIEAQR